MEFQESDRINTPAQEIALAHEPQLIAKHPNTEPAETGVIPDLKVQASIEQPRLSRQLSESDLDNLARIVGRPSTEKHGVSPTAKPINQPLASPQEAGTQHDNIKMDVSAILSFRFSRQATLK